MLIATSNQVFSLQDGVPIQRLELDGIRCLDEGEGCAAIGLADGQVVVLANGRGLPRVTGIEGSVECIAVLNEEPLQILLGTDPAHLYMLNGDGGPAKHSASFAGLACRDGWYTPWGGPPAVRSLARQGDWVYADIHVGSIMRSPDRGATWEPVTPDLHDDVHQVATGPAAGMVYANTADAVFISPDNGQSWDPRKEGLPLRYGRALAVHPQDPDCLLASVSRGPGGDAQGELYYSGDAGGSWTRATAGFPAAKGNIDTFQVAFDGDGTAWAAVEDGIYRSDDKGESWSDFWRAPAAIVALACYRADSLSS